MVFLDHLESLSGVEYPVGRYLVLFLAVTNRKSYTDTFTAYGDLEVIDSEGRTYDEDILAWFAAWQTYETDIGASIPPRCYRARCRCL